MDYTLVFASAEPSDSGLRQVKVQGTRVTLLHQAVLLCCRGLDCWLAIGMLPGVNTEDYLFQGVCLERHDCDDFEYHLTIDFHPR